MSASVKFCVTAIIDLVGFSNQLEVGFRDLESSIGESLIKRLSLIDKSLTNLEQQAKIIPDLYPKNYKFIRINDSLVLTMDLDDKLKPALGEIHKTTFAIDFESNLTINEFFKEIESTVIELAKFLAIISRIHCYIDAEDKKNAFPGCKTIVSTGFRKVHTDYKNEQDFFSANFSFSNAYLADQYLKDHTFFVDSNILLLIAHHKPLKGLLKSSLSIQQRKSYKIKNILNDEPTDSNLKDGKEVEIQLFHQSYYFQEVDSAILSYLQISLAINDYLSENEFDNTVPAFVQQFEAITTFEPAKMKTLRLNPITIETNILFNIVLILKGRGNDQDFVLPNFPFNLIK